MSIVSARIGLVGYFGWGNFGDELMLRCWRDALSGADAEPVHTILRRPYFERPAAEIADGIDAVIIGGGDLMHPDAISSLYWNRAWLRRPVIISGIGVALERQRERPDVIDRLRTFVASPSVHALSARDEDSADWITSRLHPRVPVEVIPDMGFAARIDHLPRKPSDLVGIVLRKSPEPSEVREVRRLCSWAEAEGLGAELLVLATGTTSAQEAEALQLCLPEVPIRRESTLDGLIGRIAGYRCLFTAKFHGAVIAARCGVPSISLRRTHKIDALARQLGYPQMSSHPEQWDAARLRDVMASPPPREAVERSERAAARAISSAAAQALRA